MEWGDKFEALQEIQAKGVKVKALENAPPNRPDLTLYLRAFLDCSTDRNERGFITFSSVVRWCDVFSVEIIECWEVLKVADTEVRKWLLRSKK